MDRRAKFLIAVLAALLGVPALAAPPTVTPSPGYDARLQESRKATATTSDPSLAPANAPLAPRHDARRKRAQRTH
ncbi:hypothetical protein [Bradyrhizobium sp. Tv2a-2]|uniref:hypothetical protein n=1 Tax=Bradyrhizobium sp. Tv2a-2 TaxID=113395 RepID=UPI0004633D67|nr:hypothetical protein [Bradyrhizobium sp. Tv2a-2]